MATRIDQLKEMLQHKKEMRKKTLDARYRDAVESGLVESDAERDARIMADDSAWQEIN